MCVCVCVVRRPRERSAIYRWTCIARARPHKTYYIRVARMHFANRRTWVQLHLINIMIMSRTYEYIAQYRARPMSNIIACARRTNCWAQREIYNAIDSRGERSLVSIDLTSLLAISDKYVHRAAVITAPSAQICKMCSCAARRVSQRWGFRLDWETTRDAVMCVHAAPFTNCGISPLCRSCESQMICESRISNGIWVRIIGQGLW